jgi:hypothetical protein
VGGERERWMGREDTCHAPSLKEQRSWFVAAHTTSKHQRGALRLLPPFPLSPWRTEDRETGREEEEAMAVTCVGAIPFSLVILTE